MERFKVGLGVVIAACLVKLAFGDVLISEARGEGGKITCDAIYADQIGNIKQEKSLAAAAVYTEAVRAWLESHPGDPIFRSTLVNSQGTTVFGYIDIICVRS